MMEELVYTSAPQGLMPGSSGFCTVEMTEGMPPETMDALESLSAYDQNATHTINWMHLRIDTIRGMRHVLSRVAQLPGEFSGRSNKLASHLCLSLSELPSGGPLAILGTGGPLRTSWSGNIGRLPAKKSIPGLRTPMTPRPCQAWVSAVGDAGVAGAVLDRLQRSPDRPLYLVRTAAMDALAMTNEMLALLPESERWNVTFCTYLHNVPRSVTCQLRWVLENSPAAAQTGGLGSDVWIDLRRGAEGVLSSSNPASITAARNGTVIHGFGSAPSLTAVSVSSASGASVRSMPSIEMPVSTLPASLHPTGQPLPPLPPPPPERSTTLKWVSLVTIAVMIPICGLIILLALREPSSMAAMKDVERASSSPPAIVDFIEPEKQVAERKVASQQPSPKPKPKPISNPKSMSKAVKTNDGPPQQDKKKLPKSDHPQTVTLPIRLPTSALSLSLDEQTIHNGSDIYEVTMAKVALSVDPFDFELAEPDSGGVRDIVSIRDGSNAVRLASLSIESDRVRFAWSPTTRPERAAAFAISHQFLVKDDKHHTTVQFEFAEPVRLDSPSVPVRRAEYSLPIWISPKYELAVRTTFRSTTADRPIEFPRLTVTGPAAPVTTKSKSVNIESLGDPRIRSAVFSAETSWIGTTGKRTLVFASDIKIKGKGLDFIWRNRREEIQSQTLKLNEAEMKKPAKEQRRINAKDRIDALQLWSDGLSCDLQFFVKVGEREILWATTPASVRDEKTGETP